MILINYYEAGTLGCQHLRIMGRLTDVVSVAECYIC